LETLLDNSGSKSITERAGGRAAEQWTGQTRTKRSCTAFPVWHYSIEEIVAEDDRMMGRAAFRGTHLGWPTTPGVFRGIFSGVALTGRRVEVDHLRPVR